MTRMFLALAVAIALAGAILAASAPSFAQVPGDNWMQQQGASMAPELTIAR